MRFWKNSEPTAAYSTCLAAQRDFAIRAPSLRLRVVLRRSSLYFIESRWPEMVAGPGISAPQPIALVTPIEPQLRLDPFVGLIPFDLCSG